MATNPPSAAPAPAAAAGAPTVATSRRDTALPRVHLIATGGTISNLGGGRRLTDEQLVSGVPDIARVSRPTSEQLTNVASGDLTADHWRRMALRVRELLRAPDPPAGFVVTHGTDTMEETAFFLDLTLGGCAPVVVTGAMRRAADVGPDGPANLLDAFAVAASPESRGRGALVVMNDLVFAARDVTKSNATSVQTFVAPDAAPLAVAQDDDIDFRSPAPAACPPARFDIDSLGALPRVDISYMYIDADGADIDAFVKAGAKGIVVAVSGAGGTTPKQRDAIRRAIASGVFVLFSTRTGSGSVGGNGGGGLGDWKPGQGYQLQAGTLNPPKARVLLQLALSRTSDARELVRMFNEIL